jgi:uncharacterized low-complexity protein
MLKVFGRSRRWPPLLVAAALVGAASQSTGTAQQVGASTAVNEKAQTGSIGPGKVARSGSRGLTSAERAARERIHRAPPPLHPAPPRGPHTTASQVRRNGGPPTVPAAEQRP